MGSSPNGPPSAVTKTGISSTSDRTAAAFRLGAFDGGHHAVDVLPDPREQRLTREHDAGESCAVGAHPAERPEMICSDRCWVRGLDTLADW
jgi:hypothetical protein